MKKITVQAIPENLQNILDIVNVELEAFNCPLKNQLQIAIAVEEIYMNIANYAYHPETGSVFVHCEVGGDPLKVTIQFMDSGKPYNPLDKKDPDITLSAEERDIGGLGFYLVKKTMDEVTYQYQQGKNILTIQKKI